MTALKKSTGLMSWITTVDHKRIGKLYFFSALFFLVIGGIEAMLIRTQLIEPMNNFLVGMSFNKMFTMHGTTMVFLAIMPLNAAFFNYFVPLMIGARDVAFPRLNAFSYWVFLVGGILLNISFITGGVPDVGWFGYANISSKDYAPGYGADIWGFSLQILGLSTLIASFNFFITIVNMRAEGMSLFRLPLFIWATLVTQVLIILSFPVITVALIFLMFDRTFGTSFFSPSGGGDVILWQHLFWVFGHPEVYILILPPMGIVSEILPTFSKKRLFGYPVIVFSTCSIGFLGFTVWAHHMFVVGMGEWANVIFSVATMAIAIPTGVKIFNWLFTLWGGSIKFTTPMLYALGFIYMFTIGGVTGVMHSAPPIDMQHSDSYFVVGHFHYVLIGGSIMGILAGIFYWFPKMFGRMLSERLGIIQFILLIIGMNLTFMSMHFVGIDGMPRRIYTYTEDQGWTLWNQVATIGAYIQALSFMIFFYNMFTSFGSNRIASADPWDGRTLEWSISSVPPEFNFYKEPIVSKLDDFWHKKQSVGDKAIEVLQGDEEVHLPNPSLQPFLATLFFSIIPVSLMYYGHHQGQYSLLLIPLAATIGMTYFFFRWAFEPAE